MSGVEQPDIIGGLRRYLADRLAGVPVYASPPRDPPARFVLIDRVGGVRDLASDTPRITVEAWAPTKSSAYALCLEARAVIFNPMPPLPGGIRVLRRTEVGGPAHEPPTTSGWDRYRWSVELKHQLTR